MIWKSESFSAVEDAILDVQDGPVAFIKRLAVSQPAIAAWLIEEEHSILEEEEFIALVFIVEVILKAAGNSWEEIASRITVDDLAECEDQLWTLNARHKREPVEQRFREREILSEEEDLYLYLLNTVADFMEENGSKPIIEAFLWVCGLTIAECFKREIH